MITKELQAESAASEGGFVPGVNGDFACLVDDFKLTEYELEFLAEHYLDTARWIEFDGRFLAWSGSHESRMLAFARRKLATIENVLGKEQFQRAIARITEEWDRRFAKAEQIEKNMEWCGRCGSKRTYADYVRCSEEYCGACDPPKRQPHGPPI